VLAVVEKDISRRARRKGRSLIGTCQRACQEARRQAITKAAWIDCPGVPKA
jgi:hypothetical protein